MASPLCHAVLKTLQRWEQVLQKRLEIFGGPPSKYISTHLHDEIATPGPALLRHKTLFEASNTPFRYWIRFFFFFYFFCLVVCLFIHFFSLVYPQRSSVNALHFPHVYFHKPVYVSTSSYICYLFWHVSEVAVIQFVAWGKVFIYSKVNTSAKKKQKTIFPACACSLRGKCPTVSALFTFKFRLWLTMNSKYTSVYCWCILLIKTLSLTASTWVEKIPIGSSNKFICRVLSGLMTYTICILMEKIKKCIG